MTRYLRPAAVLAAAVLAGCGGTPVPEEVGAKALIARLDDPDAGARADAAAEIGDARRAKPPLRELSTAASDCCLIRPGNKGTASPGRHVMIPP